VYDAHQRQPELCARSWGTVCFAEQLWWSQMANYIGNLTRMGKTNLALCRFWETSVLGTFFWCVCHSLAAFMYHDKPMFHHHVAHKVLVGLPDEIQMKRSKTRALRIWLWCNCLDNNFVGGQVLNHKRPHSGYALGKLFLRGRAGIRRGLLLSPVTLRALTD